MIARTHAHFGLGMALAAALLLPPAPVRASGAEAERAFRDGKAATSDRKSRPHYQRGVALAQAVLARNPDDPAGLLWYAANQAALALTHGKLYALRVIPDLERTLLHLERTNPNYDHAAAARVLGRLYHKAPALISIGSNKKADEYLGRALARAPDFPGNQAFAADLYLDLHDCPRARPLAARLLSDRDLARFGPDAAEWLDIARSVRSTCR